MLNIQSFDDTKSTNWELANERLDELVSALAPNGRSTTEGKLRTLLALKERFEQGERSLELHDEIMSFKITS